MRIIKNILRRFGAHMNIKNIKKLLFLTLFCLDISATCPVFTPHNTEIHFDLDETLLTIPRKKLWWNIAKTINFNINLIWPLAFGIKSKQTSGCIIGHPWYLLSNAITYPQLRPHVQPILDLIVQAHAFIPGAELVLERIKEKGYSIAYVTNKDRYTYELVDAYFQGALSKYANKNIVHYLPKMSPVMAEIKTYIKDKKNPNDAFKKILKEVYTLKPTDTMFHIQTLKPSDSYTKLQRKIAEKKYILFFDDTAKNIQAAETDPDIYGVQTVRSALAIAQALLSFGILNEANPDDAALIKKLETLEYQGWTGTIKKFWRQTKQQVFSSVVTPSVLVLQKAGCFKTS